MSGRFEALRDLRNATVLGSDKHVRNSQNRECIKKNTHKKLQAVAEW